MLNSTNMNSKINESEKVLETSRLSGKFSSPGVKISSCIRLALGFAAAFSAGALRAQDCRVDLVIDMTDAGRALAQPTADSPAFYFPLAAGYREIGNIGKTSLQTSPPPATVENLFFGALAASNYRLLTKQSAPTLLLIFEWGYIVPHVGRAVGAGGTTELADDSDETAAMTSIVGGDWLNSLPMDDVGSESQVLLGAVKVPRYYVKITALDFKSSMQKKRVVLWIARVSTEAEGLSLADALPTLISAAGPKFGKETVKPLLFAAPVIHGN